MKDIDLNFVFLNSNNTKIFEWNQIFLKIGTYRYVLLRRDLPG